MVGTSNRIVDVHQAVTFPVTDDRALVIRILVDRDAGRVGGGDAHQLAILEAGELRHETGEGQPGQGQAAHFEELTT